MNIRRVVPNIQTDALEACRIFYADFIGMEVEMDLGWIITLGSADIPNAQLTIIRADQTAPVTAEVTIEVDDAAELHAEAQRRQLEIVYPLTEEPWGVRRFFVKDPAGKVINVMSHIKD